MKYLGIDYGTKRIGIAISDEGGSFAFPAGILSEISAVSEIEKIVKEKLVEHLVVGMPAPGGDLTQTAVRSWGEQLSGHIGLPVSFQDETLTSHHASARLVDTSRLADSRDRMRGHVASSPDASAAALILQRYLDKQK